MFLLSQLTSYLVSSKKLWMLPCFVLLIGVGWLLLPIRRRERSPFIYSLY
jgi:cytochrome c-type biogenesis protein CcmH/NrfF